MFRAISITAKPPSCYFDEESVCVQSAPAGAVVSTHIIQHPASRTVKKRNTHHQPFKNLVNPYTAIENIR